MPLDFDALVTEAEGFPTVQGGLITVLARVRNAIEAALSTDPVDPEYLRWLAHQLDTYAPLLADAVLDGTPGQAPHEQRAADLS